MNYLLTILRAIAAGKGSGHDVILIKEGSGVITVTRVAYIPLKCLECRLFEECPFC